MKSRVYFPYVFILRILIAYCVKKLFLGAAAAAEAKHLNQRPRKIEAARRSPRQLLVIDEIPFNILHRLAARADQVMMRFKIAFHQQRGSMRADFPQQSVFHEQPQVLVDGS